MAPVRLSVVLFAVLLFTWTLLGGASATHAQVSDIPRVLTSTDGQISGAVQIGRRLYVGGAFREVEPPTRGLEMSSGVSDFAWCMRWYAAHDSGDPDPFISAKNVKMLRTTG